MARLGAEPAVNSVSNRESRLPSDLFLNGLSSAERVVFISHVHPDPDSLGSMLGLAHLVETRLDKPTLVTRDGPISRAENRVMTDVLHLDLCPIESVDWTPGCVVVMVDSQPNTGRHSFCDDAPLYAVVDHHETPGDLGGVPFIDIRPEMGATCTVVTQYLREQRIRPSVKVATALLYGLETECGGYPREACSEDDDAFLWLYPYADKDLLAFIRNARRPQSHYDCLFQAMRDATIHDKLLFSWVNPLPQAEQAAEVVDFLIRHEKITWAVCAGVYGGKMILSARAAHSNANAGVMLRRVVAELGAAGGHERRAGGCIILKDTSPKAVQEIRDELLRRLRKELKLEDSIPHPLISCPGLKC